MLRRLKKTWQKLYQWSPARAALQQRDNDLQSPPGNNEKPSAPLELRRVQGDIEPAKSRDAELLSALNERITAMHAASEAASREIEDLRECLADTAARQEKTETRIRQLQERQEAERQEHQAFIQKTMERERRQNTRLGWSMLLACCALLLGTFAGTMTFRDEREYAGLLAGLSRDIKDLRASLERQMAARQAPDPAAAPDRTRDDAGATAAGQPDAARQPPDIAATVAHYHPDNKYRNPQEMRAFFDENSREPGVISVADGLQYRVVDQGAGKTPRPADTVILDYSAYLLDGTQLFSSYDEPLPVQFNVSQLVPGLREVVPRMEEGARWEVYISPDYAYRGGVRKRKTYGYEPLVYVVELRSVLQAGDSAL